MLQTIGLVLVGLILVTSAAEENPRETVHDDPAAAYPYLLVTVSAFGRIHESALVGSEVPIDSSKHLVEGLHIENSDGYLAVELYENPQYKQEAYLVEVNETSSTGEVTLGPKIPLPANVRIDISREHVTGSDVEEAFTFNEELRLAVGERRELFKDVNEIEFWAVAVNHTPGHPSQIISNPLAFVITIDHEEPEREGATIYVGIVFGAICLFVLLIPFTVRTKRRLKQGKPIFSLGSHKPKEPEEGAKESGSDVKRNDSGRDNLGMILNEGQRPSKRPHETFQTHEMRSFSHHHFQPHWLDPHYNHTYEHPDYRKQSLKPANSNNDSALQQPSTSSGATASRL